MLGTATARTLTLVLSIAAATPVHASIHADISEQATILLLLLFVSPMIIGIALFIYLLKMIQRKFSAAEKLRQASKEASNRAPPPSE